MNKQNISNMTINVNREKDLKTLADELRVDVANFKKKWDGRLSWRDVETIQRAEKKIQDLEGGEA